MEELREGVTLATHSGCCKFIFIRRNGTWRKKRLVSKQVTLKSKFNGNDLEDFIELVFEKTRNGIGQRSNFWKKYLLSFQIVVALS